MGCGARRVTSVWARTQHELPSKRARTTSDEGRYFTVKARLSMPFSETSQRGLLHGSLVAASIVLYPPLSRVGRFDHRRQFRFGGRLQLPQPEPEEEFVPVTVE